MRHADLTGLMWVAQQEFLKEERDYGLVVWLSGKNISLACLRP